ncbi:MAG: ribonuclease HII [Candidatus Kerfeldbacteria bacterium RIFOXYA2_FULL_38_24]|uniref:Ribonuclease HII n=1 Tax=Candidatus Kerfeldbacteria bacterium RIFOXYB2_FULL_38_14 TaxID=1798547 RepID=A0A1G2BEC9_9BACT|nr:MAG: ribonuclease HII [Candidatus Kerfeldbacteria bacterium RIFOXYA2_FULL_38_24]OGY87395.1 MAG: ribonuclease HII [Candidatus Kerfeldbacteria bacterium RIFOXYB2_FULL_38_14]OGY90346.1 MAG: ribonuclease HII [Candidatus Kerfeldbacteria bacterium RIFOXYC2_FULL_38_9]
MFGKPHLRYERRLSKEGYSAIVGVDEVGRGAWAGPIISCAIVMPLDHRVKNVRDSKELSPRKRKKVAAKIQEVAISCSIGIVENTEIDEMGIVQANEESMIRAIRGLSVEPDYVLVDAFNLQSLSGVKQSAVAHGDATVYSIAAASIVAKVTRDQIMDELDRQFPKYGFDKHKGYGTEKHKRALDKHGVTQAHRLTFHPMKTMLK